jgi:hypothetical protein
MRKPLEDFMEQNKDAFNDYEPSAKLWNNLQNELQKKQAATVQQATVKKLLVYKWIAAASVTLLIGLSVVLFTTKNTTIPTADTVVQTKPAQQEPLKHYDSILPITIKNEKPLIAKATYKKDAAEAKQTFVDDNAQDDMLAFKKTQAHFANLIANKENEIKNLAKNNPEVYKNFSEDIAGLNKAYKKLNQQLPNTHNKSALVQAMIYNLQIQIDLLNKQLIILNKIESTQKKEQYEKNILSI